MIEIAISIGELGLTAIGVWIAYKSYQLQRREKNRLSPLYIMDLEMFDLKNGDYRE